MPTVKLGAWYFHSETFLLTLVFLEDPEKKKDGIKRINNQSEQGNQSTQIGYSSVRPRRTPEINEKATNLIEGMIFLLNS